MRLRPLGFLLLISAVLPARAEAQTLVPFAASDTLDDIRAKITVNRYDFTVKTNWVFNMSPEQKAAFFSRRPSASPTHVRTAIDPGPLANVPRLDLPAAFCWTNVGGHTYIGPIRNQGDCGSCYSFGACATAEGVYNVANGKYDSQCADFSESFIAWCLGRSSSYSSHFFGCDGADYDYYELQALTVEGVCTEAAFPYRDTDPGSCTHWGDPRTVFSGWYRVPCNDITAIKTAIMTYGVVDAAVLTTPAFDAYSSGIYQDTNTNCPDCEYTSSDHAIALVGWNDNSGNGYWILRNSWGSTDWGERGYMRIKYKAAGVACAVAYLVYTNASAQAPPTVTTDPASLIASNSAVLNGTVNPQGTNSWYWFEYGLTTNYGSTTVKTSAGSGSSALSVSNQVGSLSGGTTYHFRIVATNVGGRSVGADRSFVTASDPVIAPAAITDPATDITNTAATVRGRVNPNGYSSRYFFEYGLTASYGQTTATGSVGSGTALISVSNRLTGLLSGTTYHFRVVATNAGGRSNGIDRTFSTLSTNAGSSAPLVTTAAASSIGANSAVLNGSVTPNGAATMYWFDYGTGITYGGSSPQQSAGSGWSGVGVNWTASGLTTQTIYHFRLAASNSMGATVGGDLVFTTLAAEAYVLLSEDFEHSGSLPAGWTQEYVDETKDWEATTGSYENYPSTAHSGTYNALFMYMSGVTRLITPVINFGSSTNQATLSFWIYMADWYRDQDELRIYYKTSAGGSWSLIATYNTSIEAWTRKMLYLPAPCSTYYIAFEGTALWGYGICIDDVQVCGRSAPWSPAFNDAAVPESSTNFVVRWASVTDRVYAVQRSTNLISGFSSLVSNLPATPPVNTYTDKSPKVDWRYYRVKEDLP